MRLIKLLLIATLASLIPGQIVRLPFFSASGALTTTDILIAAVDLTFLIYALSIKRSLKLFPKTSFPALLFILSAVASTILASGVFNIMQIGISSLFLARFIIYFFLSIVIYNIVYKKDIDKWLKIILFIGFLFIVLGFCQYVIFPDLSFLTIYGWDPHQQRVVSTLLDPNFSGLIFTIIFTISTSFYLYKRKNYQINFYTFVSVLSFIALILTFSRSSYLAFLIAIMVIGILKSPKLLFFILVLFVVAFLQIGQVRTRVVGAFTLDETSQARIASWQRGFTIFKNNFLFGVGFNTYRYAQIEYSFFSPDEPEGGHSGSGSDSSLILVAATTGIVGLFFYLYFLFSIFVLFAKKATKNYLHLSALSIFLALLVHSQFVNSLFFPQIMILLWVILGLVEVYDT